MLALAAAMIALISKFGRHTHPTKCPQRDGSKIVPTAFWADRCDRAFHGPTKVPAHGGEMSAWDHERINLPIRQTGRLILPYLVWRCRADRLTGNGCAKTKFRRTTSHSCAATTKVVDPRTETRDTLSRVGETLGKGRCVDEVKGGNTHKKISKSANASRPLNTVGIRSLM